MLDPLMARADVSVVVWVHEDARPGPMLASVLASLDHAERGHAAEARAAGSPDAWLRGERLRGEVVLVADVSPEAATGLLGGCTDPRVRVVRARGAGRGRARNLGVAVATGRYVLFTDDDVRVPEGWVWAMAAPLRAGHADLVVGGVALADHLRRSWLTHEVAASYLDVVPDPPVLGREFAGASMGASRAVLESVGFDEALGTSRYAGADDIVFRRDVIAAGYREHAVGGVPVERWPDTSAIGAHRLAAQARMHGRCSAYVDRHLRGARPELLPEVLRLAGRSAEVVLRSTATRRAVTLRAWSAVAYHREMLALRSALPRVRPRGAARDLPLPPGTAARAAEAPRPLVSRADAAPTVLPPVAPVPISGGAGSAHTGNHGTARQGGGPGGRGSIYQFWGPERLRRVSAFPVEGRTALQRTSEA